MIKVTPEQKERTAAFTKDFKRKYLDEDEGRKHIERYENEKEDVKKKFKEIKEKYGADKDITDDILYGLLPHTNTKYNRQHKHRISTWPAVTKDVKTWFENAGWQKKKNWPNVAIAIYRLIDGLTEDTSSDHIEKFNSSPYSKGFQAGMISPILYCLDETLLPINNKTVDTVNFVLENDIIDSKLENYLKNIKIINEMLEKLNLEIFDSYDKFDAFCHWMCDKRLGGYARVRREDVEAAAPEIKLEITNHNEAIWVLLKLGKILGYERYTAHPQKKFEDGNLGDIANLSKVPHDYRGVKRIQRLDVIWYDKHSPPAYFFQVDVKGDMKSALDRLYEARNLNAKFLIVSPLSNKEKFEKGLEIDPHRANRTMYKFLSFDDLAKLFEAAEIYHKTKKELL